MPNALPRFLAPLLILAAHLGLLVSNAFAAAPFPMSSGNYAEGFDDITNWTNSFASGVGAQYWSSVPVNSSGTIPNGVKTSASTATFVSGTTEGVQKGSGNIQLLATNGTDNTHAVAIDLLLDFTGMNAGTLSYDFATVFNPSGNRNGSLRVYTSTDGVTFTELTDASVVDFQNNVAFSKQVQLVPLPAAFTNSATARIRFYDYNGTGPPSSTGARPKASIDNVVVTGTPIGAGAPSGPAVSNFSIIPAAPVDTPRRHGAGQRGRHRSRARRRLRWPGARASRRSRTSSAWRRASGDFWQTASPIPAQAGGTVVYYQVTAADDSVTVQSPVLHYTVAGTGERQHVGAGDHVGLPGERLDARGVLQRPRRLRDVADAGNYSVNGIVAVDAVREPGATKQVMITVRSIPPGDRRSRRTASVISPRTTRTTRPSSSTSSTCRFPRATTTARSACAARRC